MKADRPHIEDLSTLPAQLRELHHRAVEMSNAMSELAADIESVRRNATKVRDRFLVFTYAEMLYAYSGGHSWADMSDDRKPWMDRAERELKEMGKI